MCTSSFVRVRKSKIMQSAVCVNFKVCTDLENRPAGDAALEVAHILAGLVHVEGPNHDHLRGIREDTWWDGHLHLDTFSY